MQLGIYQHYKGQLYRVLGVCRHSETLEELVYYECLYDNPSGQFWVRPRAMFEGELVVDGVMRKRFTWVNNA
ncbi:MAG: DUF1653 domain-containing protein [Alphaproteobacteria bacterium]|nr:DUF1653 domain-containing protein [Alphaproteobacteria bacterium]